MALDSQAKRMAAAGVGRPYMRATFPNNVLAPQRPSIGLSYPVGSLAGVNRINRGNTRVLCRDICREDTSV